MGVTEEILKEMPQKGECAVIANTMFKLLKNKKITLKEYLERCAYWGVKNLADIYFRSLPSRPLEVISYEQLSWSKRNKLGDSYFADHPELMKYYDQKIWVLTENKTSLYKLEDIKKYLPESDIESHKKLDKAILDFKMKIKGY